MWLHIAGDLDDVTPRKSIVIEALAVGRGAGPADFVSVGVSLGVSI